MDIEESFPARLQAIRKERNLSQVQVAAGIASGWRTIQGYELGQRSPGLGNLVALADFFQLSLDELVGRTPPERNRKTAKLPEG